MNNKIIKTLTFLFFSALLFVAGYFVSKVISLSFFVSYFTLGYFLLISLIAYTYRKFTAEITPSCDVIIPAYNEGRHVYETIRSAAACDYDPAELTITVVDDGSTDDTREWIRKAVEELPQVRAIYLPRNSGKKHALSTAIKSSEAEILVTIDSDSIIEKEAITNIVRPFADATIGAVAGHVRVQNIKDGVIPQMMDIIFVF